jgi:hypothetical protein
VQTVSRRHPLKPIGKPRGRPFVRGRSGNPGGRPADPTKSRERYDADVRKLAREHGPDAIKKLKDIMDSPSAPFSAQADEIGGQRAERQERKEAAPSCQRRRAPAAAPKEIATGLHIILSIFLRQAAAGGAPSPAGVIWDTHL